MRKKIQTELHRLQCIVKDFLPETQDSKEEDFHGSARNFKRSINVQRLKIDDQKHEINVFKAKFTSFQNLLHLKYF